MNALQNLIKQVNPNAIVFQSVKKKPKFFAHFDTRTLEVVSINNTPECEGYGAIELQEEHALKLLSGKENLSRWIVGIKDDKPELQKIDALENFYINRAELNPIIKLDFKSTEEYDDNMFDVVVRINRAAGTATFVYNGDIIKSQGRILRFYFTREDDPSHLKCVMRLDKETLDRVVKSNDLVMWPNPLTFKIPYGADDLSIYTIKSDLEIIVLEEK